jgi:hypothetical protein
MGSENDSLDPPDPAAAAAPPRRRVVVRIARRAIFVGLFLVAAALGSLGGVLFAYGTGPPRDQPAR